MNSLIIVYLFGGMAALIALAVAVAAWIKAWRDHHQAQSANNWLTTNGSITESVVEEMPEGGGDGPRLFRVRLRYSYQVAGVQFEGSRIHTGDDHFGSQQRMQELAAQYSPGARVDVHYNPSNPAEAVLKTRSKSSSKALILGIVFLVISACIVCLTVSFPFIVNS